MFIVTVNDNNAIMAVLTRLNTKLIYSGQPCMNDYDKIYYYDYALQLLGYPTGDNMHKDESWHLPNPIDSTQTKCGESVQHKRVAFEPGNMPDGSNACQKCCGG